MPTSRGPILIYIVSPGGDYAAATWTGINVTITPWIFPVAAPVEAVERQGWSVWWEMAIVVGQ